jgi:hypothetical protein
MIIILPKGLRNLFKDDKRKNFLLTTILGLISWGIISWISFDVKQLEDYIIILIVLLAVLSVGHGWLVIKDLVKTIKEDYSKIIKERLTYFKIKV